MGVTARSVPGTVSPAIAVLTACASADPAVRATVPPLLAGADWERLYSLAGAHGLLPLLYWRAHERGVTPPAPWAKQLRARFEENARFNLLLSAELISILRDFESVGIPALSYKGPAFATALHDHVGLRESSDLDLLLPRTHLMAAREILSKRGYRTYYSLSPRQERAFLDNECEIDLQNENGLMVDLHWNIVPSHYGIALDVDAFWQRRRTIKLGGADIPIFSPADAILITAIHGTKHMWTRLSWLWDLAEAIQQAGVFDAEALLRETTEARTEGMLLVGVAVARDLLGLPLQEVFEAALRRNRAASSLASTLAENLRSGKTDVIDANRWRSVLSLNPSWRSRAACMFRFISTSGVGEWRMISLPDSLFGLYPLVRWARLTGWRSSQNRAQRVS